MLSLAGNIYGRAADLRNALYNRAILPSYSLGAKTISVGNITAGGTGKTPVAALVAKILAENGELVCILTRGYGRRNPRERILVSDGARLLSNAENGGDEPVELARKLIGVAAVVADADRVAAAKWAIEKFGITAFVLDDGFQHRRAKRDLDIVCIDATDPFGNGKILPAGTLREPPGHLNRAGAIIVTRSDLARDRDALVRRIREHNAKCPVFFAENRITRVVGLDKYYASPISELYQEFDSPAPALRALVFCGIGNPGSFFRQLDREFDVTATEAFRDHHHYTQKDIDDLTNKARRLGAEILLTTAKDAVKLESLSFEIPCFVVETEVVMSDEPAFRGIITAFS